MAQSLSVKTPKSRKFRVEWSGSDNADLASHVEFEARKECLAEATRLQDRGIRYIWIAERGRYYNNGGSTCDDWMYFWWNRSAEEGNAGPLPSEGEGVPREKSWRYRVGYTRLDDTTSPQEPQKPSSQRCSFKLRSSRRRPRNRS